MDEVRQAVRREVPMGLWILALLSLSFYVCYPYR